MKKTFTLILIFSFALSLHAQEFSGGFIAGVCGAQVDGDEQSGYKKPGVLAGVWISRTITKYTDLKIETYYVGKGAIKNIDSPDGSVFQEFKTSLHYVEVPFLWNINLGEKIDIALGVAPSYLFAHTIYGDYQSIDKNLYSMKNFDVQGMGQVDFFLTDKISSSIRFSYSAVNIRNDAMTAWFNNNLSIAFRYKIR